MIVNYNVTASKIGDLTASVLNNERRIEIKKGTYLRAVIDLDDFSVYELAEAFNELAKNIKKEVKNEQLG